MYTSASIDKNVRARVKPLGKLSGAIRQAQVVGAVVGLAGGIFAAASGAVFTAASWFVTTDGMRQWLSTRLRDSSLGIREDSSRKWAQE